MGWYGGGLLAYTALQNMGIDLIGIVVMGRNGSGFGALVS